MFPHQCEVNNIFTATMHAGCHPDVANCNSPSPSYTDIEMKVTSDDFCGYALELELSLLFKSDDETSPCHLQVQNSADTFFDQDTVSCTGTELNTHILRPGHRVSYRHITEQTQSSTRTHFLEGG